MTIDTILVPGTAVAPADLHAAAMAAFSDYIIGPFQMTFEQWPAFLGRHAVDLGASRVALPGGAGRPVAFALVAPRPATRRWRLAMVGALPAARGSGVAGSAPIMARRQRRVAGLLLDDVVARAGAAGVADVELECIAQNARALALYERRGFVALRRLNGWIQSAEASRRASAREPLPEPQVVDHADAFAWLDDVVGRVPDVPLQVTSPSLAMSARALTCWRLGSAQLVFSVVDGTPTQVHSLVDTDPAQHDAQVLLRRLRIAHPAEDIVIPPLQRDDLGGDAARREGFAAQAVHQVLMVRPAGAA